MAKNVSAAQFNVTDSDSEGPLRERNVIIHALSYTGSQ
jgi:hypothetical protein